MYNSIKYHLSCIVCSLYQVTSPSHTLFYLPQSTVPSGNHHTVVVSMRFFFLIPLPFSPSPTTPYPLTAVRQFSIYESVSILLVYFVHKIPHMSEIIRYLPFSIWLISLSIILSRFIHAVAKGKISFVFTVE